jgi:hypothetical protein
MSGARQAALVLHGLAPADREWMLARLPEPRQQELGALLEELQSLGLPPDAGLIHEAIGDAPAAASPAANLMQASAEQMHALLAEEPDRLVALLVSSSAWPWKERFFVLLGAARAQRVRELALLSAAGPALREAVLASACSRLEQQPQGAAGATPARAPINALAQLRQRWAAWTSR